MVDTAAAPDGRPARPVPPKVDAPMPDVVAIAEDVERPRLTVRVPTVPDPVAAAEAAASVVVPVVVPTVGAVVAPAPAPVRAPEVDVGVVAVVPGVVVAVAVDAVAAVVMPDGAASDGRLAAPGAVAVVVEATPPTPFVAAVCAADGTADAARSNDARVATRGNIPDRRKAIIIPDRRKAIIVIR